MPPQVAGAEHSSPFNPLLIFQGYGGRWEVCSPSVPAQAENDDLTRKMQGPAQAENDNLTRVVQGPAQASTVEDGDLTRMMPGPKGSPAQAEYGSEFGSGAGLDQALHIARATVLPRVWFRGFLEPQFEGGHEVGWRH